jgi:drug/metabolite transporter (DMT)-like permease
MRSGTARSPAVSATPLTGDADSARRAGSALGLLGVVAFSITLPATRIAVVELDPVFVGLGRAVVAAVLAAAALALTRQRFPTRGELPKLVVAALGVVFGFPLFSALAMRSVPASHGAILTGLLPLATAAAAAWFARERPSRGFWTVALLGSALVVAFGLIRGGGSLHLGDLYLLAAVAAGGIGYAEGARLSMTMGGWQVISWVLVLSAPFLLVPVGWSVAQHGLTASWPAWLAFAYVSLVSQYLGFFAWYRGLALGGIARVGQLQLLQPFLTLAFAALLVGEQLDWMTAAFAVAVVACVAAGRRMPVRREE